MEAATLCSGVRLMHHDAIEAVGDAQCQPARVVPVCLGRCEEDAVEVAGVRGYKGWL